jgi:acyl-CoA synthetase (AMP-forming)/AMP-acid ligase II
LATDVQGALTVAAPRVLVAPGPVTGTSVPVLSAPAGPRAPAERLERAGAPAFVQFTSGSTARPRGAVLSQRAALTSAWAMAGALGLTAQDVGVAWLPFFHDMGLVGVVLSSLAAGFPVHVLPPGEFLLRPSRWLELLSEARATVTVAPNFAFDLVLRRASSAFASLDLSRPRFVLNGSEPVVVVELRRKDEGDVARRIRGRLSEVLGVMVDRVELVGAGDLPRTTSGKLRRGECIARFGARS